MFIYLHKRVKYFKEPKIWPNVYSQSEIHNEINHINWALLPQILFSVVRDVSLPLLGAGGFQISSSELKVSIGTIFTFFFF